MENPGVKISLRRGCWTAMAAYLLLAVSFYFLGGDQLRHRDDLTDWLTPTFQIGEVTKGVALEQPFSPGTDTFEYVTVLPGTYARKNTSTVQIQILNGDKVLGQRMWNAAELSEGSPISVGADHPAAFPKGTMLTLRITSPDAAPGNAVTFDCGGPPASSAERLTYAGKTADASLCFKVGTRKTLWFGTYYWRLAAAFGLLLAFYCLRLVRCREKGKNSLGLRVIDACTRYRFLIHQLVSRDFKTKYKRSVLGVFWSFLNPLLMLLVQYVIFSTLFKQDIVNFPVYLLIGIIAFNFFSESCSMSLMSIAGNASLITKVYVPKYIYPLSRTLSSMVNLLLALIPLMLFILFSGTRVTPAYLLLPFGIFCLVLFCLGLGMLLGAAMVFFRDTQFLWGVVSTVWMYATPIFYPEKIVPQQFALVLKINPLYHFIRFARIVVIDGVSPEPKAYLLCLLFAVGMFAAGALVFKKTQDDFILYL